MLRLTTNVTVSPASSARSSSAASRISSIASGRVSANSAVSSSALSATPSRPFSIAPATRSGRIGAGGSVRPEPRRGMKLQYLTLIVSITARRDPLGVDVLRVHAQPLGQREAVRLQLLAHLVRRGERVLGRDVIAVRAQPAEVGRAGRHELAPPVGEVRRDLDARRRASAAVSPRSAASCPRCSPGRPTPAAAVRPRTGQILVGVDRPCASTRARPRRRSRPAPAP